MLLTFCSVILAKLARGLHSIWTFALIHPWKAFFYYSLLIGVFVQAVLLPFFFPALHAGSGMLVGGDWVDFHLRSLRWAEVLRDKGWVFYQTQPHEPNVEQELLTIIYAYFIRRPWVLTPLLAFFHASSAWLLFQILGQILGQIPNKAISKKSLALIGTLPFLLLPSSLIWVSQIHKDGAVFMGCFAYFSGWVMLITQDWNASIKENAKKLLLVYGAFLVGTALTWMSRGYFGHFLQYLVGGIGLSICLLTFWHRRIPVLRAVSITVITLGFVWSLLLLFPGRGPETTIPVQMIDPPLRDLEDVEIPPQASLSTPPSNIGGSNTGSTVTKGIVVPEVNTVPEWLRNWRPKWKCKPVWTKTPGLPEKIDGKFYGLATVRKGYLFTPSQSNIDSLTPFCKAEDLFRYLPRATAIGFGAPFPNMWFTRTTEVGAFTRKIASFEMMLAYLLFPFLIPFCIFYRRSPTLWFMFSVCAALIIIYSSAVPNMGSLYRFRYAFWTTLLGFSSCGLVLTWQKLSSFFKNFHFPSEQILGAK